VAALAVDGTGNVYVTGPSTGAASADFATIKYDANGNQLWAARYGTQDNQDQSYAIAVDNAGNVHVTGSTEIGSISIYATVKYDANGNEQWVANYGGPGNGANVANKVAVDPAGNVYVTGSSTGLDGSPDYATVKYDAAGNQLWVARYKGTIENRTAEYAHGLAVDTAGNVYVTGESMGFGGDTDYVTVKYDANGNQQWAARYGSPDGNDIAYDVAVDATGNVYVTGSSRDPVASSSSDYATVKYDANGNQLWVARYNNGVQSSTASALTLDAAGNVYVSGWSRGIGTAEDYATVKYDNNGNQLWVARYNGPANGTDVASKIAVDAAGNVIVLGYSANGTTPYNFATVKYDANGNQLWVERYDGSLNGQDLSTPTALAVDVAGNIFVGGRALGAGTYLDFVTLKYSP